MDNLAHALTGALIARTLPAGWNGEPEGDPALDPDAETTRPGRWVMWASVVAANLPDFEALVLWPPPLGDKAAYLLHHRGWSHSLVGIAAEAAAFAGFLWLLAARGASRGRSTPDPRPPSARAPGYQADRPPGSLFSGFTPARGLAVAALGAGSHLFLDWWNAYGVRPFYPFDKSWYYGDLVFVVDPWVWLMLGGAVVCGTRRFGRAKWLWYALTFAATAAVAEACRRAVVPWWVLIAWLTGVAEIAALRWWGRWRGARWIGWGMVGAYLGFAVWITAEAPKAVSNMRSDVSGVTVAVLPVPAQPWQREVLMEADVRVGPGSPFGRGSAAEMKMYATAPGPYLPFLPEPNRRGGWRITPQGGHRTQRYPPYVPDERDPRVRAWRDFARVPTVVNHHERRTDGSYASEWVIGDLRYQVRGGTDWSEFRLPD